MLHPPLQSVLCQATALSPLRDWTMGGVSGKLARVCQHWPEDTALRRKGKIPREVGKMQGEGDVPCR